MDNQISTGDLVKITDKVGMYRVESISGRSFSAYRSFEDGSKGESKTFDKFDVAYNKGAIESRDDGRFIVPLSRSSERLEKKLAAQAAVPATPKRYLDRGIEQGSDLVEYGDEYPIH